MKGSIAQRLEYLRGEIVAERISYSEIAELQSLAEHIEPGDNLLLEWANELTDSEIEQSAEYFDRYIAGDR
jgi:hypothetical protein